MGDEASRADIGADEVPRRFADDEFYQALAARPRRRVLAHLLTTGHGTVDELVDVLCGWETTTNRVVDASRAEQLRIELVHNHLPVLDAAGLLSYDRTTEEVVSEPLSPSVERLVRWSIEAE